MISILTILVIGFSVIAAMLLFVVYLGFIQNANKSWFAIGSCGLLLLVLCCLQIEHLSYLTDGRDPLDSRYYRLLLFCAPPLFFLFSRAILFSDQVFTLHHLPHILPVGLAFLLTRDIAIPLAFLIGLSYCAWLLSVIYHLRKQQKQYAFELFFYGFFTLVALIVLLLGLFSAYKSSDYFYYFYANGIGLAFFLVVASLIVYPDLLAELNEVVALSYAKSTLCKIDVAASISALESLMAENKLHRQEDVGLSSVAEALSITSHQLSELINTHYGVGFAKFIRQQRIKDAQIMLKDEPSASVLSISLSLGFRSQSSFYAAFKEMTGKSPGQYRKDLNQA